MHRTLILLAPLMLAGCAATVPPLPVPSTIPAANPYDIAPALDMADKLSAQYAQNYQRTAGGNRWLALPTIAAAAGAAVLTVANPPAAAKAIAYIGIGAGAYEIGRGALSPKSLPGLYLKGYNALACIHAESSPFLVNGGPAGQTGVDQLASARTLLGQQIATAQAQEAQQLASDGDEAARTAAQQAQGKLSESIVRARALFGDSAADEVAGRAAPATFRVAVTMVAEKVARKGLEGTDLQYPSLLDSFKAMTPPRPDPSATSAEGGSTNIAVQTQKFVQTNANLLQRMAAVEQLQSSMPFAKALDRVKACPAGVD